MKRYGVKLVSTGKYVPPKILTNFDLEKMVDTSDEWITTRTGIKERHIADENTAASDLALFATKDALNKTSLSINDIDTIIVATITPDMFFPSTACMLHKKLGMTNEPISFDISAACSGFVYGICIANSMLSTGLSKNLLLVGTEVMSKFTNWKDRNTCVLFGDGAGAMVLTRTENPEEQFVISAYLGADGKFSDLLFLPAGGSMMPASYKTVEENLHTIKMSGKEVFKIAVTKMAESVIKSCE